MSALTRRLDRLEQEQRGEPYPKPDPNMEVFYLRRTDGDIDEVTIDDFI